MIIERIADSYLENYLLIGKNLKLSSPALAATTPVDGLSDIVENDPAGNLQHTYIFIICCSHFLHIRLSVDPNYGSGRGGLLCMDPAATGSGFTCFL
jgi:hypothetical protein